MTRAPFLSLLYLAFAVTGAASEDDLKYGKFPWEFLWRDVQLQQGITDSLVEGTWNEDGKGQSIFRANGSLTRGRF